mmetsp:Transcript_15920/g.30028  ORF Transcript_15920/g.30028 Transcript_15920/m.30028 type:complete len:218 (+) Transcript_15920:3327-3980(+)
MHWKDRRIIRWEPVVHERKYSFLILSSIPRSENNSALLFNVEHNRNLRVQSMPLPILINLRTGINHRKIWLKIFNLVPRLWSNEHVRYEMLLPCHFMNKPDLLLSLWIGTTKTIKHICLFFAAKVFDCLFIQFIKDLRRRGFIHSPPINISFTFATLVQDDPLILWRPTREFSSINSKGFPILCVGNLTLAIGNFMLMKFFKGQIVIKGGGTFDAKS